MTLRLRDPKPQRARALGQGAQRGISLVIVIVLIGAMALASAASLRASAGSLQLLRVRSMQALALEQAHWALHYCEAQLRLASAARNPALADAALPLTTPAAMAWPVAANWQSGAIGAPLVARGLSPDHSADAATGATRAGAAVWLQSKVLITDGQVRARSHKLIVNPPLR